MEQSKYEQAQHIAYQIEASGGAQPGESISELCRAIDPEASADVIEIVSAHRNADGSFRTVANPADKAARLRATRSLAEER